ncbi:MAG: SPOR domain-containing protein [Gammaproteobacteria bacterium]|nr:SPOR domain-containing protein [Gammaproteobacteria bacterium]MDJ0891576.1 SPOR domain-containing protein [Gammaproteobacteria bacterium]
MEDGNRNRPAPDNDFNDMLASGSGRSTESASARRARDAAMPIASRGGSSRARDVSGWLGLASSGRLPSFPELAPAIAPVLALLAVCTGAMALWLNHRLTPEVHEVQASLHRLEAEVAAGLDIQREVAALTTALEATQSHLAALDDAVARQTESATPSTVVREFGARLDTLTAAVEELHARAAEAAPSKVAKATPTANAATWAVHLSAFSAEGRALAEVTRLQALEIPAEKRAFVDKEGRTWHRVFVQGFESRTAAETARAGFQSNAGVPHTWVERVPSVAAERSRAGG